MYRISWTISKAHATRWYPKFLRHGYMHLAFCWSRAIQRSQPRLRLKTCLAANPVRIVYHSQYAILVLSTIRLVVPLYIRRGKRSISCTPHFCSSTYFFHFLWSAIYRAQLFSCDNFLDRKTGNRKTYGDSLSKTSARLRMLIFCILLNASLSSFPWTQDNAPSTLL